MKKGTPLNLSAGKHTRSDNEASRRPTGRIDLGMGEFNPRAGANTKGSYIVDGISIGSTGKGPKRSHLRSAGESR